MDKFVNTIKSKRAECRPARVVRITHANKHDVLYIGRAWKKGGYDLEESKWHNPFFLKRDATDAERKNCLSNYRSHIRRTKSLYHALPELRDKTLGCWCKPLSCHGNVLVELLLDYVPPPPKRPHHRILENGRALVEF